MRSLALRMIFIFTVIFTLSNCAKLIFGINNVKELDESKIYKLGDKYGIPKEDIFELDTSYFSYLFSLDTAKYRFEIKNHYQPLQALYYKNNHDLESFQVNCYAGGFPNLNWERDSIMSSFPPLNQAPTDSILPLTQHLKYLRPLPSSKEIITNGYDYIVIVYWNRFMGRQTEKFIEVIQKNQKVAGDLKANYIYVNTDNCFALYD